MPLVVTTVKIVPAKPGTVCARCGNDDTTEIPAGTDCLEVTCAGPFGEQVYYVKAEHQIQHGLPDPS